MAEHGRLIDADALMKEFSKFVKDSNNSDFADVPTWNDAVSLVESAPTIVLEPYDEIDFVQEHKNIPVVLDIQQIRIERGNAE